MKKVREKETGIDIETWMLSLAVKKQDKKRVGSVGRKFGLQGE